MRDTTSSEPVVLAIVRVIGAAVLYFLIVFVTALVMGPVRVLWLEPALGPFSAVLCELPLLLLAMWIGAGVAPRATGLGGGAGIYLAVGILALLIQLVADVVVGFGLRGLALQDQLAYFATPAGLLYLSALLLFACMPALRWLLAPVNAHPPAATCRRNMSGP